MTQFPLRSPSRYSPIMSIDYEQHQKKQTVRLPSSVRIPTWQTLLGTLPESQARFAPNFLMRESGDSLFMRLQDLMTKPYGEWKREDMIFAAFVAVHGVEDDTRHTAREVWQTFLDYKTQEHTSKCSYCIVM